MTIWLIKASNHVSIHHLPLAKVTLFQDIPRPATRPNWWNSFWFGGHILISSGPDQEYNSKTTFGQLIICNF